MILVDGVPFSHGVGQIVDSDGSEVLTALLNHPSIISAVSALKSTPKKDVPEDIGTQKYIYVLQREYATVNPAVVQLVGTDEATTCVGIAIRNRETGMTSIAHMDSPKIVNTGLTQMLALLVNGTDPPLDVHLIGGFDDMLDEDSSSTDEFDERKKRKDYSLPLCNKVIGALHARQEKFHMQTLCILQHNTQKNSYGKACPIFDGFLFETSSGSVIPARFCKESKGPDELVRRIRMTVSSENPRWKGRLLETNDTKNDRFQIAPFSWSSSWKYYAYSLQELSDTEILLQCSTSPFAEGPDFVETMRRVYNCFISNPDSRRFFPTRMPRVFKRTIDGGWARCPEDN